MTAEIVGGPLAEHLAVKIPRAAKNRHKRFKQVPQEDFEQAMWVRVLSNPPKFRRLFGDGRHGTIWLELLKAGSKLGFEDDRYRRAQAAAEAGYDISDEAFYSPGMLEHLLPVLIEAEFDVANAIEKASNNTDAAGVRIQGGGGEGDSAMENYAAILIDVIAAFSKLNLGQQRLLKTYYGISQEDTEQGRWERSSIASSMGITLNALQLRVYRAIDALSAELGGVSPWLRPSQRPDDEAA